MLANPIFATAKPTVVYTGQETDVNVFEDVGSPSVAQEIYVYITPTSVITGFNTGAFPEGSLIRLFNRGYILGHGGAGGNGGPSYFPVLTNMGQPGEDGGPAISLGCDIVIYMTSGYIWGGGGGGGGGSSYMPDEYYTGGGGGGGVSGGAGGNGPITNPDLYVGEDATTGINATPGAGGDSPGLDGGAGGTWGSSGQAGQTLGGVTSAAGGNGGLAIEVNGFTYLWGYDNPGTLYGELRILGNIQ